MTEKVLTCVFFPDLHSWEREGLLPVVQTLERSNRVEVVDYDPEDGNLLKGMNARGPFWIFANRWERALSSLQLPVGTKVFVSVLAPPRPAAFFTTLFWKRFRPLSPGVRLVTHSPLSFRFLCEISGLPPERIHHLSLPMALPMKAKMPLKKDMSVGVVGRFTGENNLHFLLSIAHYVANKRGGVHFHLLGAGPLQNHLEEMVRELGLQAHVSIDEGTPSLLSQMDMFLYLPLQNSHFLPVLKAASLSVPVLACEIPGIENFIQDGRDGFVVPIHETKPLGELVLRLAEDVTFRTSLGQRLQSSLYCRYQPEQLQEDYSAVLGGKAQASIVSVAA